MSKNTLLKEYFKRGYSIIPVGNDKKPLIKWKPYQDRKATQEEIYSWSFDYPGFNVGVVTGKISGLYSLDFDTPESYKAFPDELKSTTQTQTARGYHLLYSADQRLQGQNLIINDHKVEFKGQGQYSIEPSSIINGYPYKFITPLTDLKKLPSFIEDLLYQANDREAIRWTYKGKQDCVRQILEKELLPGERENTFFILKNLLLQGRNTKEYIRRIMISKNKALKDPLPESELMAILKQEPYKVSCSTVKGSLPYIDCKSCKYYKEVRMKIQIPDLWDIARKDFTSAEKSVMLEILAKQILDERNNRPTTKTINQINKTELARTLKVSRQAIYDAINSLKKKGIFQ